ncbi:MAG: hypothetical protein J6X40_00845 [Bacteroidales bacterium]|nr:hypothetical protein [Bacteroidales bacterium]
MRSLGRLFLGMVLIVTILSACSQKQSVFSAHTTPHHFQELAQATAMMDSLPGQALQLLEKYPPETAQADWSEVERQEYRVLLAEAQYKTGALGADSEPLEPAVTFFDSLVQRFPEDGSLRFLLAKSHYYLGAENTVARHDVAGAAQFVAALRTTWAGNDAKDVRQTRFRGLCHYRLGEILYNYNIQSSAFHAFDSARYYFEQVHDTLGVAACIRSVGEVYQGNKDYEGALAKFKEANHLWNFGEAWYDHALGGLFFEHRQFDSAAVYLERSFETGGPYTRIDAAAKLAEIWRERGDREKEASYTLFYVQNSIRETNRSSDKMEIEFIYDGIQQPASPQRSRGTFIAQLPIIACVVFALIALMAFIIIRNRRRISHIERQLSVIEKSHREETEGKDQQLQTIAQELDATKQQLERRQQAPAIDFEAAMDRFLNAPVTLKIRKSLKGKDIMTKSVGLYPKLKLSEMDFIELVRTANSCFPDCSSYLLRDYGELSTGDVRHCCLALMGLNDAEIAVLEGITYSGANRRTKRILSIMNDGAGLEETVLLYLRNLYK